MNSGIETVRFALQPLACLPCWKITTGYSSWLTFHFGQPRISVQEALLDSAIGAALHFRRMADVEGEFRLWIEMSDWVVFQDGERLADSESSPSVIRKAAAALQGQILVGVQLRHSPAQCEFVFDLGGKLCCHRYAEFESTDGLWHLFSPDGITTFLATGESCLKNRQGASGPGVVNPCIDSWILVGANLVT